MKLVSVIIPTKNSSAYLERCLASVKAQTYPEIEIIIVDNHSIDDTPEIASRFGKVITAGPERSSQCNQGAQAAHGEYLYRIDGDFILDPQVVESCVSAVEDAGADIVAVPNRSVGESYWARVRQLERDTYLDDDLIVAARFWRREAFEAVGGFDESLVSCEDYDLHIRLVQAGYRQGRIEPGESHLGESASLWDHTKKSFYYGPSTWHYMKKHPSPGFKQMFPLRASYWRHRSDLLKHPRELLGLFILKTLQYGAAGTAIALTRFGLFDENGRFSSVGSGGLILLLVSLATFLNLLPRYGFPRSSIVSATLVIGGFITWLVVGKRRAQARNESLSISLATVSLCFSPYLLLFIFGEYLMQEAWLYLFSIFNALVIAWLVYFAEPNTTVERWVPWAFGLVMTLFIGFFVFWLAGQLNLRNIISPEIISFDQGLWATANGIFPGRQLLHNTILDKSVFSEVAAPVLLFYLPLYKIGFGGPFLLLVSQVFFTGIIAFALYRLGEQQLGRSAVFFLAIAFLFFFFTPRFMVSRFHPEIIGIVSILLGLDALERRRTGLFFVWMFLALISGEIVAVAVSFLGIVIFFRSKDRWIGFVTFVMGGFSAWILMFVFRPYFGGLPFALPLLNDIAGSSFWIHLITQPEILNYLILLLAPLAFLPLLGLPWLLPALPMLILNILLRQINVPGPTNALIAIFLFIALIFGFSWFFGKKAKYNRPRLLYSGVTFVFVMCFSSGWFLNAGLYERMLQQPFFNREKRGSDVLTLVPAASSLATQSSTGLLLAHRAQLNLLPEIEDSEFVLMDIFSPIDKLQEESLPSIAQKLFNNPDYGIEAESEGVILFSHEADPSFDIETLARAELEEIQSPSNIILDDTVAYRGYSVDTARLVPDQLFVITTYWQSLAVVQRPYLFFSAYPGGQQFQEAVYGLYPIAIWQPGDLIRHRTAISLPKLPTGQDYEIVTGLWFDTGKPALTQPSQLLGEDVVRIAKIIVTENSYRIQPWNAGDDH